jgi:hypothetical protein
MELRLRESSGGYSFVIRRSPWHQENEIGTVGIDFGPHVFVLDSPGGELGEYHIVKVPGHMAWAGIGQRDYYETYYYIMRVNMRDNFLCGEMIYEIAPGRKWRQALVLLREKIKELQAG